VLEPLGRRPDLAKVYAEASSIAMDLEKAEDAFAWGRQTFALIAERRDTETLACQLNNTGTMALLLGRPDGRDAVKRSIALAVEAGLDVHVGRGYIHRGWAATRARDFRLAERLDAWTPGRRHRVLQRARPRPLAAL
jgi:hypothetical protein